MATHIVDNTKFYNVASPGTGAASGDTFFLTAANIDLVVNGLNNDGIAIETNNDTLVITNGGSGDFIYPVGNSDAIVQANTFLQSIIDLGQNTILDVQSNPNGFDVIYNQPNDPGFSLVVNPSGFSGLLFLSGIQITAADLSPVNANGVQTLTLKNSGATVDSMKIIGLGNGTLTMQNAGNGVYLTENNPFIHGVTV